MSTIIPVICDEPACGTVWFSGSIFGIGPGATINSTGNKAGPCPTCNGMGHIPDGQYTHAAANLFNPLECNLVLHALELLRQKAIAGATSKEIENDIEAMFPFLNSFSKFLPKNAGELAAYLAILVSIFMNMSNSKPEAPAPEIHIEVNVSQALEQVSKTLKNNQKG